MYYIDSNSFNTATSVYSDVALSTKAPDGYYSFNGVYRRQLFGELQELTGCDGNPVAIDCVVSEWSAWGECIGGYQTRTRTVITPASNGGTSCPVLSETQACTVIQCVNYLVTNTFDPLGNDGNIIVTYVDCNGTNQQIEISPGSGSYFCAQEGSYVVPNGGSINVAGYC